MAIEHSASATWQGDLMDGSGTFSTGSGVASGEVTWRARAEDASAGTSPEELIAAALASCFSMALSHGLAQAGTPPTRLETEATAGFQAGQGITGIALTVRGQVEGVDEGAFREAAEAAKDGCPVSKALNVEITLDAAL